MRGEDYIFGNWTPPWTTDVLAGVTKRPASNITEGQQSFTSPCWICECGHGFTKKAAIDATLITLTGAEAVLHQPLQCTNGDCRLTFHYNYKWVPSWGRKELQDCTHSCACIHSPPKT
eukprot:12151180-Karenia_brevis.AAC.1